MALVIVNNEEHDVKAGADGATADAIEIPVITVRRSVGEPLVAHAGTLAAVLGQKRDPPWARRGEYLPIEMAFGRATAFGETGGGSGGDGALEDGAEDVVPGEGWRGDPALAPSRPWHRLGAGRLRRAGPAARSVGAVSVEEMEWEDNWRALTAQSELLLTPHTFCEPSASHFPPRLLTEALACRQLWRVLACVRWLLEDGRR